MGKTPNLIRKGYINIFMYILLHIFREKSANFMFIKGPTKEILIFLKYSTKAKELFYKI